MHHLRSAAASGSAIYLGKARKTLHIPETAISINYVRQLAAKIGGNLLDNSFVQEEEQQRDRLGLQTVGEQLELLVHNLEQ